MLKRYLPTGDFLVVNNEPVGHGRRQFDGLQPETHVTLLQNLIVQTMFQRNNCTQTERETQKIRSWGTISVNSNKTNLLQIHNIHLDVWWHSWAPAWCSGLQDKNNKKKRKTYDYKESETCSVSIIYNLIYKLHDVPSSVRVWLAETPSVSVTTTEYLPKSSLSGLVKVSLELRNKHILFIFYFSFFLRGSSKSARVVQSSESWTGKSLAFLDEGMNHNVFNEFGSKN